MTDQTPTVSIIVPIYNVEDWLALCCDSLIAQSWTDWEAILLVDGSPDRSIEIAEEYAQRDPRFRAFEIENRGIGGARNAALDKARGEFIVFIDSDDELTPRALEMLLAAQARSDAEVTTGYGEDLLPGNRRRRYWTFNSEQFFRRPSVYTAQEMPSLTDDHVVWGKLISRSMIDRLQLRFPEGVHCEDIGFALRLMLEANRVAVVTETVYLHRRHGTQVSADYLREKTLRDWITQAGITLDIAEASGVEAIKQHYALNHSLRQWMTRSRLFCDIQQPELLEGVESMAERILDLGNVAIDDLDVFRNALLHAFAQHVPSRKLRDLPTNPLLTPNHDNAVAVAEGAIAASRLLDSNVESEGRLAAVLLIWQVLSPAANGMSIPDELILAAEDALGSLPTELLAGMTMPETNGILNKSSGSERALATLLTLPNARTATIGAIHTEGVPASISGNLQYHHGFSDSDRFSAVFIGESGKLRSLPVSHTRDGDIIKWHAIVPKDMVADSCTVLLRRTRRYADPVDFLTQVDNGTSIGEGLALIQSSPVAFRIVATKEASETAENVTERLFTFPNWYSNPYTTMLHTEPAANGCELTGTADPRQLLQELRDTSASGPIHIHWTSQLIEKRESKEEADTFVNEFIRALEKARSRGRAVLWTVHNALPHDSKYPETAIRLHAEIARVADIIHVLSTPTVDAVNGVFELPEHKIRVLEHSSYMGVYGDREPMGAAREAIGASPEARTVLFFGQLRPYKGLDQLFDASILLQDQHPVELLLAGKPAPELKAELQRITGSGVAVTRALRFIEDNEVAAWFSAADVTVLPYRKVLNSGSMMLAATFGVPLVLPAEEALLADYGDEPWIRFFDTERASESIAEILADDWYLQSETREAALAFARGRSPVAMSRGYARLLREAQARAAGSD